MSFVWNMLNILQLISYMTKFTLMIPDNVYVFFQMINDMINMKSKFLQDLMDSILDSLFILKREENGEETNVLKNLGSMLFALVAVIVAILFVLIVLIFVSFFEM